MNYDDSSVTVVDWQQQEKDQYIFGYQQNISLNKEPMIYNNKEVEGLKK